MIGQLVRFGAVGFASMGVHWLVVTLLVPFGLQPLVANVIGFATAFCVSYTGHRNWTFASAQAHATTLGRFLLVALASFALNELLYSLLLRYTTLDYRTALAIVLIAVAGLTFVLSRWWAFRPS